MYEEFENIRKQSVSLFFIGIIVAIASLIASVIDGQIHVDGSVFSIFYVIGIFGGIGLAILGGTRFNKVSVKIKSELIPKLVREELGVFMQYNAKGGLTESEVCRTRIMQKKDRFHSEDLIYGEYEGVDVRSCDVTIEERHTTTTKNGTTTTYVPTFIGRFFEFKFSNSFDGVVVSTEGHIKRYGLERVELESVVFNKKFKTFTDQASNAFYILTPPVMEAILRIEEKYKGVISIEFDHNYVYVSIYNNIDTFKFSMFKKIDVANLEVFKEELRCIAVLINELQTNRIYREEK